jgi:FkbM family methyltransferase
MDVSEFLDGDLTADDIRQAYCWILGRAPSCTVDARELIHNHGSRREFRRWLVSSKAALHQNLISRFGTEKWVATELLNGRRIWINLCDRHASMGCLIGEWEPNETTFMRQVLKPGQTVVDAGANVGWFSLVAADCVGNTGTVYAFEPQARIFRYLKRTIEENGLVGRVRVHECALSNRRERIGMTWDPDGANMGRAWLIEASQADPALGLVDTAPLDEVIPDARVDFMKIDTEGAEMLVLAGAVKTLKRSEPILMVEVFPPFLRSVSRCEPAELYRFLADLGYAVFELADPGGGKRFGPMADTFIGNCRTAVFVPAHAVDTIVTSVSVCLSDK